MFAIAILASFLAGVTIVVSRIINANLAQKIGLLQGTFFNYIVGLIFAFFFLIINKEPLRITNHSLGSIPVWAYFGGLFGVVVVMLQSYISHKIPSFNLTLLIFIGQLFMGIAIDYFTLHQLSIGKVIGGIFVLAGLIYNLILDQKKNEEILE
ncbi:DMT family transporter [Defluviitalea raffinosedens]|jgi:transporter family-2 protein|uniref:EamA family transporter n=1 Tax=Defluviitalea raffinosedens TaxID=1450156 RepID=A0A7C8LDL4_9FIRM|nr:DMT family transporter [Defluviitalea raffinosedens]KAE9634933.1 EamA family transporter [Defluviitalea raffinosedens]MBM7685725.1 transporter family-2 protein [Defluviitalea raffinosedens]MBZ4667481.1 putative Membrane Spanning Protein [Defluviitaleaceae bacterium]HHW66567.1 DMT family transporter [Candidatus Epulonipiscium sp.]